MSIHQKILNKGRVCSGLSPAEEQSQVGYYLNSHPVVETQSFDPAAMEALSARLAALQPRNCAARFLQLSSQVFPADPDVQAKSQLPLCAVIQPFADLEDIQDKVSHFGGHQIIRCEVCRTYINIFSSLSSDGRRMTCNLCETEQTLPDFYRTLSQPRVELSQPAFEFSAGQDFFQRPPQSPLFLFVVDVQEGAELLEMVCLTIKELVEDEVLLGGQRTSLCVLTYDQSSVHLYLCRPNKVSMVCLTDWTDPEPELPLNEDLLLNLLEHKEELSTLLDSLPLLHQRPKESRPVSLLSKCLGVALRLARPTGGKLFLFQQDPMVTHDPFVGASRASQAQIQDPTDMKRVHNFQFAQQAREAANHFISLNVLIMPSQQFKHCLYLAELAKYMNGQVKYFANKDTSQQQLFYELRAMLIKPYTWESVFRIRISSGWRIKSIFGNYSIKTNDLLAANNLDEKQSLTYEFEFAKEGRRASCFGLQTALLYTTTDGKRRIRVHNYSIPLTQQVSQIYSYANYPLLSAFTLKYAFFNMQRMTLREVRNFIQVAARNIYQKHKALSLQPLSADYLPSCSPMVQNCLAMLKHSLFLHKYEQNERSDLNNCLRIQLNQMAHQEALKHFAPTLYRLDTLPMNAGTCCFDDQDQYVYPPSLPLSAQHLSQEGIYMMDAGDELIVMIGQQVSAEVIRQFIGQSCYEQVQSRLDEDILFFDQGAEAVQMAYDLATQCKNLKSNNYCPIRIVLETGRDAACLRFFRALVLDAGGEEGGFQVSEEAFLKMIS